MDADRSVIDYRVRIPLVFNKLLLSNTEPNLNLPSHLNWSAPPTQNPTLREQKEQ